MKSAIRITWLGAAGFQFEVDDLEFLTDPFLSRNDPDIPQNLTPANFQKPQYAFIGHGHFDHVWDLPSISRYHSGMQVFASNSILHKLRRRGVPSPKLSEAEKLNATVLKNLKVSSFPSKHIDFDWNLVKKTCARTGFDGFLNFLPKMVKYPSGNVQSYLFEIDGYKILFLSSAGSTPEETTLYSKIGVDLLLLPVQGNSNILEIAARIGAEIQPRLIIPHHHDNFYSPISQNIDLSNFPKMLKSAGYNGSYRELKLFEKTPL